MRARPRPPIRLLLLLQAEERTGRLYWRHAAGERSLLLASGLVVGAEGQPESFLEYLARACGIPPGTLGRIERRVRDLFLPLESEIARATGLAPEEIAAARRDFTLAQVAELCLQEEDPSELRFEDEAIVLPGAACQVPPATALADLMTDRLVREAAPTFPPGALRPTRLFPRLAALLELAFPWRVPLPQAGGETADEILGRSGADRAGALYLLIAGGLLAEEAAGREARRPPAALAGVALPAVGGPLAMLEALEQRLAADPFNQEAIEALERLASEEGWPELLVEMQERLIAKAPPPQRGYYFLRLAALADIAALPAERHAELVSLGRRSLPRDSRLACASAYDAFRRGDDEGARLILSAAGITWPPTGPREAGDAGVRKSSTELVVRPEPSGLTPAMLSRADLSPARATVPAAGTTEPGEGSAGEPAGEARDQAPGEVLPEAPRVVRPEDQGGTQAEAPGVAPDGVAGEIQAGTQAEAVAEPQSQAPQDAATAPRTEAGPVLVPDAPLDSLGPLMAALQTGDDDTLQTWLRNSLPELPRVRRASQAILDAAKGPAATPRDHVARFARALGRALDELGAAPGDAERANLRADLFVQLADLFASIDPAAALVAAARAVTAAPDHEPAAERLERLAIEQRDADTYAKGFAVVEEHLEGSHNKWAFAYRQGRTLETEFARSDLALDAYLRALGYQPRTGAVLAAIERLAKAANDNGPVIRAYKQLAAASDGAQRAYWRTRLAEHGVTAALDDSDSGWSDLLDESAPAGHPLPAVPPAAPTAAGAASTATRTEADGEPARGIEEALLRATPAFGIPILRENLPPEDEGAASAREAGTAQAAVPLPAPAAPPEEAVAAEPPPARVAAPPPAPAAPPEKAVAAEPPPAEPPEPARAGTGDQAAAEAAPPAEPRRDVLKLRISAVPETGPEAGAAKAGGAPAPEVRHDAPAPPAAPASAPFVILEPEFTADAARAKDDDIFKDVSWLDDDVEMVIEYPRSDSVPPPVAAATPAATGTTTTTTTASANEAATTSASEPAAATAGPDEPATATTGASAPATAPEAAARPAVATRPAAKTLPLMAGAARAVFVGPAERERGGVEVGETPEVAAARARLRDDVTDLDAIRVLAEHSRGDGLAVRRWVAESILSLFDPAIVPSPPAQPPAAPTEMVLSKCGPWEARFMHRAMAVVWEHCAATFAEELPPAIRPAHQISPLGRDHLARGIAECSDRLAFFRFQVYRGHGGREAEVLRTRPPSVVVGAELDPSRPEDLTRLAVGVARCVPEHLLPSTLAPAEREALLQGLLCAFGPPGCVPRIAPRAATVAQDLWHFIPPRAQAMLRTELAAADVAESGAWVTEVHARCLLLGVRVSHDLRTALRLGLAADAAVPTDKPLSLAELRDALRWSSITRRLLRAVLSEGFQQGFSR
ncbi:MAG: hypothetical protein HY907_02105 [Deltaproteobacteria bacterium]|nr:hypothetical protein [Deltaproteobacteria bacterium]